MLPFEVDFQSMAGDLVFGLLAFITAVALVIGVWRAASTPRGRWALGVIVAVVVGYVVMGHWLNHLLIVHGMDVPYQRLTCGLFGAAYMGGMVLSYRYRGPLGPVAMLLIPVLCYGGWAVLGPLYADLVVKLNLADVMPWGPDYTGRVLGLTTAVAAVAAGICRAPLSLLVKGMALLGLAILITRMNTAWNDLDRGLTSSFKASVHDIEKRKEERDSSQAIRDVEEKARGATELKDVYEYNAQLAKLRKQNDKAYEAEMAALNAERGPRQAEIRAMSMPARVWATFREALGPALMETAVAGILTSVLYYLALSLAPPAETPTGAPTESGSDRGPPPGPKGGRRKRKSGDYEEGEDPDTVPIRGRHPGVEGVVMARLSADAAHGLDPDAGTWRGVPLADSPGPRRIQKGGVRQQIRWPRLADGGAYVGTARALAVVEGRPAAADDAPAASDKVVPFTAGRND